jgi:adenine-specific DNA-methyltransferase
MNLIVEAPVKLPKAASRAKEDRAPEEKETQGVVVTKPHVVNLILDLAGYTADRDLTSLRLLEPSCGLGSFLGPAVERLIKSAHSRGKKAQDLEGAIVAFGLDPSHVARSRRVVTKVLKKHGVAARQADKLATAWITEADFLLAPHPGLFDAVVGNPPYLRIEGLAQAREDEYRKRYVSLYDRADLYIAYIERGLSLLSPEGVLSFICADRWVLNRYGAPLRRALADKFKVRCYIDLHKASPFDSEVIAYPSIFAISPGKTEQVHVGSLATASPEECQGALAAIKSPDAVHPGVAMSVYSSWFEGEEPWVLGSPAHLDVLRALEAKFSPIEAGGATRVGIGAATGNDKVYIVDENADIERDRLVPIVVRDDIEDGEIKDAKRFVINTFRDDGGAVDLANYPKLAAHLQKHGAELKKRHVAQKHPASWFRTIDRIYPALVSVPKLLVPDIASSNGVVFDTGRFHPHHNLYYITSDTWDMEVLGGLLSSKVALFFVWSYAVKMRGGYLRFQAQYLRRIRLPSPHEIPARLANSIRTAFRRRDFARLDELALRAYGISELPEFDFVDTRV